MQSARHLIWLAVKAKTGASRTAFVLAGIAALCSVAGATFLLVALYVFLTRHYGALESACALALALLALSGIIAMMVSIVMKRTAEQARAEIAQTRNAILSDPGMVAAGMQIGRSIGWQRIVPIAVIGLLVFGLSRTMAGKSSNRHSTHERTSSRA